MIAYSLPDGETYPQQSFPPPKLNCAKPRFASSSTFSLFAGGGFAMEVLDLEEVGKNANPPTRNSPIIDANDFFILSPRVCVFSMVEARNCLLVLDL